MNKIKVGIVGGAGYTAGELSRILIHHPQAEISWAQSSSQAGKYLHEVHSDLLGESELRFSTQMEGEVDLIFFCGGHGKTKPFLEANEISDKVKLIDLSNEFRLESTDHNFIYGLPELNREKIKHASKIANPGCFATCIQLGLLPLAHSGKWKSEAHVSGITGSTGAGQQPRPTTHFSWRSHNLSTYKAFTHQHLGEIRQSLEQASGEIGPKIHFVPMRGPFSRGILVSTHLKSDWSEAEAREYYSNYYSDHPFTHYSETNPHLKQVVNTNKAVVYVEKFEDQLHIVSVIDNLLKGASGQAVQNMNLMFGLAEGTGLGLKASAF
ncbi:MAG: N-acetyl-gamma-glutamyl-phosphate reductase [Bacteroidia bacterium]|nr:N-acetyl-gamma-glutamyl-phosphate reductase [Bacteroidia bacterium]